MKSIRIHLAALVLLLVCAGSPDAALVQLQTGNLYGTAVDDRGQPLPGVTVTLTGQGEPQVQVTNAQGQFRFLGLPPGQRQIKTELEGFSTVDYPNINVGRNTSIEVTLSAAVEDVITVTDESPVLDERRIATGRTVSETELEKIPTARDPWEILQQAPGVLMDRINVGGECEFTMEDFANLFMESDQVVPKGPETYELVVPEDVVDDELEKAVRDRVPGRWRDIEKILAEADRMQGSD